MRKILSLLLTLCLFLTPVHAMAEGTCTQVQISDISLAIGDLDNRITLGMSLLLTMLSGDKGASLSLAVNDAEDNSLAAGGVSVDANGLTVLIDGMQSVYHLSYEALAALYPEEAGMSPDQLEKMFNLPVPANNEELPNSFTTFAEHLTGICNEVLSDAEPAPTGVETVSVFDAEYELQRVDLTVPAEAIQKVCLALLDEMSALSVGASDPFATARDELTDIDQDLTMRLWYNEDRSVVRVESDLYTADGEFLMPLVGEFLESETEGVFFQISTLESRDESTVQTGVFTNKDLSGAVQFGLFADSFDANGDMENTLQLLFGSDTYDDSDSLYAALSSTDASGTTELGCRYIYQYFSEDPIDLYSGYLLSWYTTYDDQMVKTDSNGLGFVLNIVRGSYDTDGTLSTEGVASIVEIDQMSEADIQQAQAELQGVLQNFIMGAMSDPGVQQLFILFSGMFNFIQSHNM